MKRVIATLIWLLAALVFLSLPLLVGVAHGGEAVRLQSDVPGKPRHLWDSQGIVLGKNTTSGETLIITSGHFIRGGSNFRIPGNPPIGLRVLAFEVANDVDLGLLAANANLGDGTPLSSGYFQGEACVQTHAIADRWEQRRITVDGPNMALNIKSGFSGSPVTDIDGRLLGIVTHYNWHGVGRPPLCGPGVMDTADEIRAWLTRVGYPPNEGGNDVAVEARPGDSIPIANPPEPITYVYVYTLPECPPCDRFKADVAADPEAFRWFRFTFFDISKPGMNIHGLESAPYFRQTGGDFIKGYGGKEWLLARLKKREPIESPRLERPAGESVASVPLTPIPDPTVPPATKPGESPTPFADSAPVAAQPVPQPMQPVPPAHTQAPPAAAARTETGPLGAVVAAAETAWTLYSVAKWAGIIAGGSGIGGIAAAIGWKTAAWAWGAMRSRRRRESQTAPSGGTRDSPYGAAINRVKYGPIPLSKFYRVRDDKAVRAASEAFHRAINDNSDNLEAVEAVIQAQNIFAQAMAAPDQ